MCQCACRQHTVLYPTLYAQPCHYHTIFAIATTVFVSMLGASLFCGQQEILLSSTRSSALPRPTPFGLSVIKIMAAYQHGIGNKSGAITTPILPRSLRLSAARFISLSHRRLVISPNRFENSSSDSFLCLLTSTITPFITPFTGEVTLILTNSHLQFNINSRHCQQHYTLTATTTYGSYF